MSTIRPLTAGVPDAIPRTGVKITARKAISAAARTGRVRVFTHFSLLLLRIRHVGHFSIQLQHYLALKRRHAHCHPWLRRRWPWPQYGPWPPQQLTGCRAPRPEGNCVSTSLVARNTAADWMWTAIATAPQTRSSSLANSTSAVVNLWIGQPGRHRHPGGHGKRWDRQSAALDPLTARRWNRRGRTRPQRRRPPTACASPTRATIVARSALERTRFPD